MYFFKLCCRLFGHFWTMFRQKATTIFTVNSFYKYGSLKFQLHIDAKSPNIFRKILKSVFFL